MPGYLMSSVATRDSDNGTYEAVVLKKQGRVLRLADMRRRVREVRYVVAGGNPQRARVLRREHVSELL